MQLSFMPLSFMPLSKGLTIGLTTSNNVLLKNQKRYFHKIKVAYLNFKTTKDYGQSLFPLTRKQDRH